MNARKILFPTDFSHTGDAALGLATTLARDTKAKLIIVHVEEPPMAYGGGDAYYGVLDPPRDELDRMLGQVKPTDESIEYEHRMITGEPANSIVRLAESEQVDFIVLGTHGRTGLSRLLMGSVAEAIVRRATCPVITFREPKIGGKSSN